MSHEAVMNVGIYVNDISEAAYDIEQTPEFKKIVRDHICDMVGPNPIPFVVQKSVAATMGAPVTELERLCEADKMLAERRQNNVRVNPDSLDDKLPDWGRSIFTAGCYPRANGGWIIVRGYELTCDGSEWCLGHSKPVKDKISSLIPETPENKPNRDAILRCLFDIKVIAFIEITKLGDSEPCPEDTH